MYQSEAWGSCVLQPEHFVAVVVGSSVRFGETMSDTGPMVSSCNQADTDAHVATNTKLDSRPLGCLIVSSD